MGDVGFPLQKIKESMRATWMAGDFGVVAKTISRGAEEFVARLALPVGARGLVRNEYLQVTALRR